MGELSNTDHAAKLETTCEASKGKGGAASCYDLSLLVSIFGCSTLANCSNKCGQASRSGALFGSTRSERFNVWLFHSSQLQ